ncbi:hypothetical protein F5X68DRAFT_270261 [Plectosphaerella plurivora]|uniref:Uncharacterized protein n=1 Tax=Plectosphaerella plurivora TaxID=936078 RepID=A0A9P9A8R2_9PEZI|nr:hypothetical protein F5X68DRAFT_270261 [Plectosphaerella plurivora]
MPGRTWVTPLRPSLYASDDDMGKKDDDHKTPRRPHWQPAAPVHVPSRRSFRRLVILLLASAGAWLVFRYVSIDLGFENHSASRYSHQGEPVRGGRRGSVKSVAGGAPERTFDGPIKFHELAASLRTLTPMRGGLPRNKNVLFAAASLQSAAVLLPMACDMGRERRTYVHFALISRDSMSIADLRRVNGVDESCGINFHDARPDFADVATDARMIHATTRALYHIQNYMHPQAIVIDATEDREEEYFLRGARRQTDFMGVPLIELPDGSARQLSWLTRLDAASLAAWHRSTVDIVVQAPLTGAGSLMRLLKSLSAMDFDASEVPHLTVELPPVIEPALEKFLEQFRWPPRRAANARAAQMLTLRRRMPRERLTEEESAARFLESFWPRTAHSHVLVLSPQAELTPQFFHYLKFSTLEYIYSQTTVSMSWDKRLLGLGLIVPPALLDGVRDFKPPKPLPIDGEKPEEGQGTSFLWQAPNSDAMLITGPRWIELQSFVTRSLERRRAEAAPELLTSKTVGKQHPAWLEHLLRLARARGYLTLYPDADTAGAVATVHKELFQAPEEYGKDLEKDQPRDGVKTVDSDDDSDDGHATQAAPLLGIMDTLPDGGRLVSLDHVPYLTWEGTSATLGELDSASLQFSTEWRQRVGGCDDVADSLSKDLFCE